MSPTPPPESPAASNDNITDYIYAMTEQIIEHITQTASIIYR